MKPKQKTVTESGKMSINDCPEWFAEKEQNVSNFRVKKQPKNKTKVNGQLIIISVKSNQILAESLAQTLNPSSQCRNYCLS